MIITLLEKIEKKLKSKYPELIWIRRGINLIDPDKNAEKTGKIEVYYTIIGRNRRNNALLYLESDGNYNLEIIK
jgi:hypothetical protein